jgi:hypothetical protein
VADLCAKSGPTVADEEFTHVNTQMFGLIDLPGNQDIPSEQMTAPFNAPQTRAPTRSPGWYSRPSRLSNERFSNVTDTT